ncbi:MAG: NB-ARC domain-containing protein, partial [Pleurocapsa sp.]
MDVEAVLTLVNKAVYDQTQRHLSDLQQAVIVKVWHGKKYHEIADEYGCTEGHAKDTGSLLWKLLSISWEKKVTKSNFRSLSKLELQSWDNRKSDAAGNIADSTNLGVLEDSNFLGRQKALATLQDLVERDHKII